MAKTLYEELANLQTRISQANRIVGNELLANVRRARPLDAIVSNKRNLKTIDVLACISFRNGHVDSEFCVQTAKYHTVCRKTRDRLYGAEKLLGQDVYDLVYIESDIETDARINRTLIRLKGCKSTDELYELPLYVVCTSI